MQLLVLVLVCPAALLWLWALAFNVWVNIQRWLLHHPNAPSTVFIIGALAGAWAYGFTNPILLKLSPWWASLILVPDMVALLSDVLYYRTRKRVSSEDTDK